MDAVNHVKLKKLNACINVDSTFFPHLFLSLRFSTFYFFFSWTLIHDGTLKHIKMGYHTLACFGQSEIIVFQELHIEGTFQYCIPLIHLNLAMNCIFFHLYLL